MPKDFQVKDLRQNERDTDGANGPGNVDKVCEGSDRVGDKSCEDDHSYPLAHLLGETVPNVFLTLPVADFEFLHNIESRKHLYGVRRQSINANAAKNKDHKVVDGD